MRMMPSINPRSGIEIVRSRVQSVNDALAALLELSAVRYEDINAGGGAFFIGWNKWQWQPLPDDAQPLVGAARRAHDELSSFAAMVFRAGAPDRVNVVDELSQWLLRLIEQPNGSYPEGAPASSIPQIVAGVAPRLDEFMTRVERLPTAHGKDERLLVADTSALLDRPDLQNWTLDGGSWTIVLVPQVLAELDERKRDPRTAEPADKVIRQLNDLDRRGDTFAGVPLAGMLTIREIAASPDMDSTLPWLQVDTPDDVIIAAALELVLRELRARVGLLASDRNVLNKGRMAGLSTVRTNQL